MKNDDELKSIKYEKSNDHTLLAVIASQMDSLLNEFRRLCDKVEKISLNYLTRDEHEKIDNKFQDELLKFKNEVREKYVTKEVINPTKQIVQNMIIVIVTAVIMAILSLIFVK